jgi:hypothetical protein
LLICLLAASYLFESLQLDDKADGEPKPGVFLNKTDIGEITDFLLDVTLKQVIPHMEQKIRMLNQQVSATRKGLKNQLKNLWWRKGKDDAPDVQTGPVYVSCLRMTIVLWCMSY